MSATSMTPLQQGMLFNTLFAPQSGVDIEQLVVQTREPLSFPRFQAAWQSLIARHPMLRTRFRWEKLDTPIQEALQNPTLFLESSALPLNEFLRADRQRGFNLSEAPLLRVTVLNDSTFVWSFHHAILDGRCYPILLRELHALYSGQELNAPPTPFSELVAWQEKRDTSSDEGFWCSLLKGFRAPTPLTVERLGDVPAAAQGHCAEEVTLSPETAQELSEFAAAHDFTLNTLVQGAWGALLARYSGEDDIVFGAVRACRHGSVLGADTIIGPLINTLPVRVSAAPEINLLSYLKALRAQHLAVRPFEHSSLAAVQALSDVPRGTNLFDSLVM
ncbi:MAG: condensation domain-containing protein, partial [Armatimonas sp.]